MPKNTSTSAITAWLKSIRIGHLIGLTAAVIILRHSFYNEFFHLGFVEELFFILPIVLISAGGNIINDYFDIKEDRSKRPKSAVIGRSLKRRAAILSHVLLTASGIATAIYLGSKYDTYIPLIITLSASVLLFLYSTVLKGKILLGNFTVAGIATAYIPLALVDVKMRNLGGDYDWLCCIVFTAVLIRQIAKDIEDYDIDLKNNLRTLPVACSPNKAWALIYILEIWLIYISSDVLNRTDTTAIHAIMGVTILCTFLFSWRKKTQAVSAWVRLLLFVGLVAIAV